MSWLVVMDGPICATYVDYFEDEPSAREEYSRLMKENPECDVTLGRVVFG